eukprot:scaffold26708_cov107-Isochrysis_galbana.AAC.2
MGRFPPRRQTCFCAVPPPAVQSSWIPADRRLLRRREGRKEGGRVYYTEEQVASSEDRGGNEVAYTQDK